MESSEEKLTIYQKEPRSCKSFLVKCKQTLHLHYTGVKFQVCKSFMYYFLRAWQWEVGYYLLSLPPQIIIITTISLILLIPFNPGELQKNPAMFILLRAPLETTLILRRLKI